MSCIVAVLNRIGFDGIEVALVKDKCEQHQC